MKKTKKSDENTSAPRKLAVYSELNQTELHRSYGVKKKEGFFIPLLVYSLLYASYTRSAMTCEACSPLACATLFNWSTVM